jgi:hypothetical protein
LETFYTLVKLDRIEHLVESRAGMPTGESRRRFVQIGTEQVVPATLNPSDD